MITVSEQTRRMSEMMEMYGMSNSSTGLGAEGETLVLNMNNDLVQYVLNNDESENTTTSPAALCPCTSGKPSAETGRDDCICCTIQ